MNPSLAKEIRPLLLPWGMGVVAGGLLPVFVENNEVFSLLFLASIAFLAAAAFGSEFQQRTLLLLLSQPCERSRIWSSKLLATLYAVATLVLLNWRTLSWISHWTARESTFLILFLIATLCSAGFWIPITRSTVRGLALSIVTQSVIFLALNSLVERWYGRSPSLQDVSLLVALSAAVVYLAGLLWLGWRFWRQRLAVLVSLISLFIIIWFLAEQFANKIPTARTGTLEALLQGLFLLTTICSAGFWTLVTRSTVGGMAFSIFSQFLVGLVTFFAVRRAWSVEDPKALGTFLAVGILYSLILLWLGWRKFRVVEIRDTPDGAGITLSATTTVPRWGSGWLVCRPRGNTLNLIRKELRLQRPVLIIAAAFACCWLATMGVQTIQPQEGMVHLVDLMVCFYVPLVCLLAACIPLGEEKTLGLAEWHLAQPCSVLQQWGIKLSVGVLIGALAGIALPRLLSSATGALVDYDSPQPVSNSAGFWRGLATLSGILFVMGYWASTLTGNTVRASLTTVIVLAFLVASAVFGSWCAQRYGGLERGLLELGRNSFQFSPTLVNERSFRTFALVSILGGVPLLALGQSLVFYRYIQPRPFALLKCAFVLAMATAGLAFWCTDLLISATR
ncbi:MAG TPA: hypothetical protein VEC99_05440 [Clostridia bacterium]|nr:hypothetical protein [Clostridia bacterium]